jgi:hypothetical protein
MPIGELLTAAFFPFLTNKEEAPTDIEEAPTDIEDDPIVLAGTEDPILLRALDNALDAMKHLQANNTSTEGKRRENTVAEDVADAFRGFGAVLHGETSERYSPVIQQLRNRGIEGSPVFE